MSPVDAPSLPARARMLCGDEVAHPQRRSDAGGHAPVAALRHRGVARRRGAAVTPRTLDALRSAVARVLVVAGQHEAVTDVTTSPCGWSPWHPDDVDITVAVTLTTTGRILERRGRDEAHAVARLWEAVLDVVWARAADTRRQRVLAERRGAPPEECAALRGEETRAAAALAAARERAEG